MREYFDAAGNPQLATTPVAHSIATASACEKATASSPSSELAGSTVACEATPRAELLRQLLDSRIPKSEREWCAAREIESLRASLDECFALACAWAGVYAHEHGHRGEFHPTHEDIINRAKALLSNTQVRDVTEEKPNE